jgi:DNA-binding CsgD family transcriptional regulator
MARRRWRLRRSPGLRSSSWIWRCRSSTVWKRLDKDSLSVREKDVLRLLSEGCRTKEIAQRLDISPRTVETYRSRLMLKLGIKSLSGLVKFALRTGIAGPADLDG